MRTRRRRKYTWFPAYGTGINDGSSNFEHVTRYGELEVDRLSGTRTDVVACVPDLAPENFDASSLLTEAITQEYILRRIVGKLHLCYSQNGSAYIAGAPPIPPAVFVAAGFFVARASDVSQADPEGSPVGYVGNSDVATFNLYSPLSRDTQREPWIWRRSWALGNNKDQANTNSTTRGYELFPATNYDGSVADGPHVDAKTVRRVGQDDRLWFAISTIMLSNQAASGNDGVLSWFLDVRYLGALRKAKQRGAF